MIEPGGEGVHRHAVRSLGLLAFSQPVAVAMLTVGSHDCCGSGRVGDGPKLCSAVTVSCGSLQAASGSANAAIAIAKSEIFAHGEFPNYGVAPMRQDSKRSLPAP